MEELSRLSDHDLLIVLHEQVKGLRDDISKMGSTTEAIINDHENRIRGLEKSTWAWSGAAGIISASLALFINYLIK